MSEEKTNEYHLLHVRLEPVESLRWFADTIGQDTDGVIGIVVFKRGTELYGYKVHADDAERWLARQIEGDI
jgi:hypothetical protein